MKYRNSSNVVRILHQYEQQLKLELVLVDVEESRPADIIRFPLERISAPSGDAKAQPEEIIWSDDDIAILREGLLYQSLHGLLDNRLSKAVKAEMLEWIESDAIEPFSFVVCASENGYHPDVLRDELFSINLLNYSGKC